MSSISEKKSRPTWLSIIGPGILLAATGVGAGDLTTAGFSGSQLGSAILWAVLIGAFFKFVMTEGLTRWQLVTGTTILEGVARHMGKWTGWIFLPYFLLWTFFVCANLMGGCGVTLHAIFPVFESATHGKIVFGTLSSIVGLILVIKGGFRLFEKIMAVSIGVMFVTVIACAVLVAPSMGEIVHGLFIPSIPNAKAGGIAWTLALIGGIGSTVTILCYGYWIAEENRTGPGMIKLSRLDLGAGYVMITVFGIAMVIIGTTVDTSGSGADLIVDIANTLKSSLGPIGQWAFLLGALGAVFSSLLGVWQSVPYLFADIWRLFLTPKNLDLENQTGVLIDTTSVPYRSYMYALGFVPMLGLFFQFKEVQKFYGVIGAAFLPLLTIVLLILNSRKKLMGNHSNSILTVLVLISIIVFFGWMAWSRWFG
jgi:Mn2+/Fe2+ NRAMP family transporter